MMPLVSAAEESPFLTVSEAARFLRSSEKTVRVWCVTGQLPAVRIGRRWLIDSSGVPTPLNPSQRGSHPTKGRIRV
jgi:excisionase family DNA binding protein